jgi:hypothetical protein
VNRNLTLTLDEDLLRAARKVALDRNTSVNCLVREYLTEITTQDDRKAKALATLERFFKERPGRVGKITWTREELYDRKS